MVSAAILVDGVSAVALVGWSSLPSWEEVSSRHLGSTRVVSAFGSSRLTLRPNASNCRLCLR